ncbi:nSTAND1 domain-containing NTPase [Streptomyces sp. NPDC004838]
MGRHEKPLDPDAGPVQRFAYELRAFRRAAGGPTYRVMARASSYSAPTLSAAAAGEKLPSLPVALAYVAACGGDAEDAARWEKRWRETAETREPLPDRAEQGPYPGLARYGPEDSDHFFGRDELVAELVELIRRRPFVALVGASGSGKSSLLRAGLVPAVREGLGPAKAKGGGTKGVGTKGAQGTGPVPVEGDGGPSVIRLLTPGPTPARTHKGMFTEGALVLVDQFEELFTLCRDPAERAAFIKLMLTEPAGVVIAVRADFYGRCAEHPALAGALKDSVLLVGPMTREQLREAVVGPATAERLIVERTLTARIVAEVADEPGGLPLMSHALLEVWRRRRGRTLTEEAYETIGGVQGAIAHTAEEVFATFTEHEADAARAVLLRLISPGDGSEDTRRPAERAELVLSDAYAHVLERLVHARLLTVDDTSVNLAHEALITGWPRLRRWIADDRDLLRLHRRLTDAARTWEELGRDTGALYRGGQLEAAREAFGMSFGMPFGAVDGASLGAVGSAVFGSVFGAVRGSVFGVVDGSVFGAFRSSFRASSGSVLGAFRSLFRASSGSAAGASPDASLGPGSGSRSGSGPRGSGPPIGLTSQERDFLAASLRAHERESRAAARTARRLRVLTVTLSVLLCLAAVAGLTAWQQSRVSDRRAVEAEARRIAEVAGTLRASDPRTAMRLSLAAWKLAETAETRESLFAAAAQSNVDVYAPPLTESDVDANDTWRRLSTDGRTMVEVGPDRTKRWDIPGHRGLPDLPGLGKHAVNIMDLEPDSLKAAFRAPDGIRIWDLAAGKPTGAPFGPQGPTPTEKGDDYGWFGPGGRLFGTHRDGLPVQLWDTRTGRPLLSTGREPREIKRFQISPDDRLLVFCPDQGPLRLWDIHKRRELPASWAAEADVCASDEIRFLPGQQALAVSTGDGVRIWDVRSGQERPRIPAGEYPYVSFSDDGTHAATVSADEIRLWRLSRGLSAPVSVLRVPTAHRNFGDPRLDLSAGTIRYVEGQAPGTTVWTIAFDTETPRRWEREPFAGAAFSPDGGVLATRRGETYQLRGGDGELFATLGGPRRALDCGSECLLMAFSPDSRAFAHPDAAGALAVRDLRSRVTDSVPLPPDFDGGIAVAAGGDSVAVSRATMERKSIDSLRLDRRGGNGGRNEQGGRDGSDGPDGPDGYEPAWSTLRPGVSGRVLATAPDGRILTDHRQLIDPRTGDATRVMRGENQPSSVAFGPDGRHLAMSDHDGRTTLWDGRGRKLLAVLVPKNPRNTDARRSDWRAPALAFSRDGRTLAYGDADGGLRLWRTDAPRSRGASLPSADGPVLALAFAPDGGELRVTTPYVAFRSYSLDPGGTAKKVCVRAGGGLDRTEWETHLPGVPYRSVC